MLGDFIGENNSSTVDCVTCRTRSVLSMPAMLAPLHHGFDLIAKAGEDQKGSDEPLATRAISPILSLAQNAARLLLQTFPIV